jgi:hypothetical protein
LAFRRGGFQTRPDLVFARSVILGPVNVDGSLIGR